MKFNEKFHFFILFLKTLSSFSNQDDGGIIIFGIDETHNYEQCGVYDLQDNKKITDQCDSMYLKVRPLSLIFQF